MAESPRQRLYAYVDETGQDTKGRLFLVALVLTGPDRDRLRRQLRRIEEDSRKRDKKWAKSRPRERQAYIEQVIQRDAWSTHFYYSAYTDSRAYTDLTILSTAKAVLDIAREPYHVTVLVDGLGKAEQRHFTAGLRKLRVRVYKVRGLKDESDEFIRLADALAGFVRAALGGNQAMQGLLREAKRRRMIREI